MRQHIRFFTTFFLLVMLLGMISVRAGEQRQYYDFTEALDKCVAVVDGEELLARDLAFYIAYEEQTVEREANIYDPEDTAEYWNISAGGTYLRTEAKNTAMDMAIHDAIFYRMALEREIVLDEEEEKYLANSQYDFWSDLTEEAREGLGISQEELNETMRKIALAEKCQTLYAQENNHVFGDYSIRGKHYLEMLEEHEYEIVEKNWDKIHFGSVTVDH